MSNLRATQKGSAATAGPQRRNVLLILSGVMSCAVVTLILALGGYLGGGTERVATTENAAPTSTPANPQPAPTGKRLEKQPGKTAAAPPAKIEPASDSPLVDDDGKSLWESPTHGAPVELAYLAPGAQIIAVLRPAAILKHPEGEKVRAALGPGGQAAIQFVEQSTGMHLADMERLVIGAQAASDGKWLLTFVVQAATPISTKELLAKQPGAVEKDHEGKAYWLANERAYYLPDAAKGKVLVVAPTDAMADIIDLAGNPPPLRRDIERLIAHTDADRHVTIIVAPRSLFSEGQSIFAGELAGLRGPLFWFLGDELSGAALSVNWDDNFFLELIATPTLDTRPEGAARIFSKRVGEAPGKLDAYAKGLAAQPYGKSLVSRLPAMVRKLAAYTRSGSEPDHMVLRCYLPVVAGHNLLMATELTLAEPAGGATKLAATDANPAASAVQGGGPGVPSNVHDALAKKTSLRFAKDTLEAALEQLSQDLGVPIVIRGPDLQAEGITKNQSFGIDLSNKPADEILVQVLRLANPDKSATGPADKRQKLVYVVEQKPDKTEQIVVTTRARAAERRQELPAVFRTAKP